MQSPHYMQRLSVPWLGHARIMHCGIKIFSSKRNPTTQHSIQHTLFLKKLTNKRNKFSWNDYVNHNIPLLSKINKEKRAEKYSSFADKNIETTKHNHSIQTCIFFVRRNMEGSQLTSTAVEVATSFCYLASCLSRGKCYLMFFFCIVSYKC